MTEEKFSPQDSLRLIQSMLEKTRENLSDKSLHFLVWGWLTFAGCTGQFVLKHILGNEKHYLVWWLVVPGVIFSIWQGRRDGRKSGARTYAGESIRHLWLGMAIAYFVLSMILTRYGWDKIVFPFFIMLYGLGTFVSGSIIRFPPLVVGGTLAFGIAIGSSFLDYDFQILAAACAILVSYIIPAYLLRSRNRHSIN